MDEFVFVAALLHHHVDLGEPTPGQGGVDGGQRMVQRAFPHEAGETIRSQRVQMDGGHADAGLMQSVGSTGQKLAIGGDAKGGGGKRAHPTFDESGQVPTQQGFAPGETHLDDGQIRQKSRHAGMVIGREQVVGSMFDRIGNTVVTTELTPVRDTDPKRVSIQKAHTPLTFWVGLFRLVPASLQGDELVFGIFERARFHDPSLSSSS
jgi:hypothetical protein